MQQRRIGRARLPYRAIPKQEIEAKQLLWSPSSLQLHLAGSQMISWQPTLRACVPACLPCAQCPIQRSRKEE